MSDDQRAYKIIAQCKNDIDNINELTSMISKLKKLIIKLDLMISLNPQLNNDVNELRGKIADAYSKLNNHKIVIEAHK
jgi:hypothetical protein